MPCLYSWKFANADGFVSNLQWCKEEADQVLHSSAPDPEWKKAVFLNCRLEDRIPAAVVSHAPWTPKALHFFGNEVMQIYQKV